MTEHEADFDPGAPRLHRPCQGRKCPCSRSTQSHLQLLHRFKAQHSHPGVTTAVSRIRKAGARARGPSARVPTRTAAHLCWPPRNQCFTSTSTQLNRAIVRDIVTVSSAVSHFGFGEGRDAAHIACGRIARRRRTCWKLRNTASVRHTPSPATSDMCGPLFCRAPATGLAAVARQAKHRHSNPSTRQLSLTLPHTMGACAPRRSASTLPLRVNIPVAMPRLVMYARCRLPEAHLPPHQLACLPPRSRVGG